MDEIEINGVVYVKKSEKTSTGDRSTGHFETKPRKLRAFNKKVDKEVWDAANKPKCLFFDLTEWIPSGNMTEQQKSENPKHVTTGGFLNVLDYKEAFTKSVMSASKEERGLIRALPNFDNQIFFEISGCDLRLLDI